MKIPECDIEQVLIFAFRYAVNRHFTQAMYRGREKGLGDIIVDNLPYIGKELIRQMIDDIEQQRIEQYDREENAKEYADGWRDMTSTAYLTPLLERLRDELAAREAVKLRGKQE